MEVKFTGAGQIVGSVLIAFLLAGALYFFAVKLVGDLSYANGLNVCQTLLQEKIADTQNQVNLRVKELQKAQKALDVLQDQEQPQN